MLFIFNKIGLIYAHQLQNKSGIDRIAASYDPGNYLLNNAPLPCKEIEMNDKRIRIVAIEDHALLLEAMGSFTNARDDMTLVAAERSARRGLQAIANSKPDVAIIAIPLSDMNGLVLAGRIINDHPATKVVILSMHEDRALVQQALQIGVKGYVSKRSPVEHLLQAITATAEGARYIDPAIASKILGSPDDNRSSKE